MTLIQTPNAWSVESLVLAGGRDYMLDLRDTAPEIAASWQEIGAPAPEAAPPTAQTCAVNGCRGMAYARVKTAQGPRSLCLGHWEHIELAPAA